MTSKCETTDYFPSRLAGILSTGYQVGDSGVSHLLNSTTCKLSSLSRLSTGLQGWCFETQLLQTENDMKTRAIAGVLGKF